MHRRYTLHRAGDLLVEELATDGKPIEPEPVPAENRLPIEVTVMSADDVDSKAALIDLLEMALEIELHGPDENKRIKGHKLDVI